LIEDEDFMKSRIILKGRNKYFELMIAERKEI
jgi:hypothetical protein